MTEPTWTEIVARLPAAAEEAVLTQLTAAGFDEAWVAQPLVHEAGPDGWVTTADSAVEIHLTIEPEAADQLAAVTAILQAAGGEVRLAELKPADWLNDWRASRTIVELADGWTIAPPWLADQAADPARCVVIDPGLAFGAGDHPTTRDSAVLLIESVRPGDRVLDVGAGSGVLSLLARKLGAGEVIALEIDPLAAAEIGRNAALNGMDGVDGRTADATAGLPAGPFDVIACNIGARPARELAGAITAAAGLTARLIVSGIADWAEPAVTTTLREHAWRVRSRLQCDSEWVSLLLERDCVSRPG